MENRNKEYSPIVDGTIGLAIYFTIVIALLTSCESIAPNTYAAMQELPEEAFTPLWMVLEGLCLDLFNLVKGLIL